MKALQPSVALLSMLGSIIVHFDEATRPGGTAVDLETARRLMSHPEVEEWLDDMRFAALLPMKRSA